MRLLFTLTALVYNTAAIQYPLSFLSSNNDPSLSINSFIDNLSQDLSDFEISSLNDNDIAYYKQIEPSNWPIDLEQYSNDFVIRLFDWIDTDDNIPFYQSTLSLIKEQQNIKIWDSSLASKFIDIQLNKDMAQYLLTELSSQYKFNYKLLLNNLPQTIFETYPQSQLSSLEEEENDDFITNLELFFRTYRDIDSIYAWFDLLVNTYPDILSIEYIGNTFEGRPMKALRLSVHSDSKSNEIKTVVITGGIHAREWISVSTTCYILFQLLQDYENGKVSVIRYLENLDFLFLPLMNPDGYTYTWTNERLWRKNKQQTFNPRCQGIDIDHSFDFHFTSGIESPCSDDYPGESAFEALESYNWDNYLNETKHSHPIYAYIDLHSYAQEVLYPYAYSCDILPRDEENLLELAYGLSQSIRLKSGKYYQIFKACQDKGADLLPSMGSGSALDYMYHNKAYWAFVLKLRDSGTHGFLLPSKYIIPVGKEIYSSVKYFAAFLLSDK